MKKIMVSAIILLLSISVIVMAESATQEDMKAVESLVDVMSGKLGDYSDRLGETEQGLDQLGKEVKELGNKVEGLDTNDKLLMEKIEARSTEETINAKIEALKNELEVYSKEFKTTLDTLAGKAALEDMGNEFAAKVTESMTKIDALTAELKLIDEKLKANESEDVNLENSISGLQTLMTSKSETMSTRVEEIEKYTQQLKAEYTNALDVLSKELRAEIAAIEASEDNVATQHTDSNLEKLTDLESKIAGIKDDMQSNSGTVAEKIANLESEIASVKNAVQINRETVDIINGKIAALGTDMITVKDDMQSNRETVAGKITDLGLEIVSVKNAVQSNEETVNTVDGKIAALEADIASMKNGMQSNSGSVDGKIATFESEIASVKNAVQGNRETINMIDKKITDLAADMTTVKDGMQSNKETINGKILDLENKDDRIASDVKELKTSFELNTAEMKTLMEDSRVEVLKEVEAQIEDVKVSLNMRLKWIDINIKGLKEDIESSVLEVGMKYTALESELGDFRTETEKRLNVIDDTLKHQETAGTGNYEQLLNELAEVQKVFDKKLGDSLWSANQRMKWMDIASGKLKADLAKTGEDLNTKIVLTNSTVSGLVSDLERTTKYNNERFKLTYMSLAGLKEDIQANLQTIEEVEKAANEKLAELTANFENVTHYNNERFKLTYMTISDLRGEIQSNFKALEEVEASSNNKIEAVRTELVEELASKIASLNMRLKWMDISSTKMKKTIEEQARTIDEVGIAMKIELNQEVSLINQKLMVIDYQIEKLDTEKAAQVDVAQLRKEFDRTVGRLNDVAFGLAFEQSMTQKMLSEIADIEEAADLLNTKVAILYAEYATKEMLEAEIAAVNTSLAELEELTYSLNEQTEELVASKVWALNQRLKWVDITIKRAKDERAELKDYVLELESRLEEEINTKVTYINMRLKWTDISITKLKETKVEKKEYTETVTRLDTVKVDKDLYAQNMNEIDMRFVTLENNMEEFKKETTTLLMAHKEMLEAKIDRNEDLIKENTDLIENNESEIQKLEARITELEREVFPEEKNTSALGVLVGFGLVVGLGMVLASAN